MTNSGEKSSPVSPSDAASAFESACIYDCVWYDAPKSLPLDSNDKPSSNCNGELFTTPTPYGTSPSGVLHVVPTEHSCPGTTTTTTTTLELTYKIPKGIQKSYHPSPGTPYKGTKRTTFVPNTCEGRQLVRRLAYAWQHGWTFCIGRSISRNKDNVVIWSLDIPQKTMLSTNKPKERAFAYPDPLYISDCHAALDALQVPWDYMQDTWTFQDGETIIPYVAPDSILSPSCQQQQLQQQQQQQQAPCTSLVLQNGASPSGKMIVQTIANTCPGFHNDDDHDSSLPSSTIEILYVLKSGTQHSFHPSPGKRFKGTIRMAYLPNTKAGRALCRRLQWAFLHGHCFEVGTSQTTMKSNVVVWSPSVPHKSRLHGSKHDPFAFPDPDYLQTCARSLDLLGVPSLVQEDHIVLVQARLMADKVQESELAKQAKKRSSCSSTSSSICNPAVGAAAVAASTTPTRVGVSIFTMHNHAKRTR